MMNVLLMLIPLFGTTIGAMLVLTLKGKIKKIWDLIMKGFAAGVMLASSIWSLIIPSLDKSSNENIKCFSSFLGLIIGFIFLLVFKYLFNFKNKKNSLMVFSVTLHNIPEGMAVGVMIAGACLGIDNISYLSACSFALAIAIQNIPEGAIVSMPIYLETKSYLKALFWGIFSGIIEPIFSFLSFFLVYYASKFLPFCLTFAAGAMLYVIVDELFGNKDNENIEWLNLSFLCGFLIMMILDVLL